MSNLIQRLRLTCRGGDGCDCTQHEAADRLEAQEALLKEAMEALRFYADEHYDGYDIYITDYGLSTENGPIIADSGDLARATLAKLREHLEDKA